MKYAILFNDQVLWWPTLAEAEAKAEILFTQNMKHIDAIHIYCEGDFMNPVSTIARQGYCGPGTRHSSG